MRSLQRTVPPGFWFAVWLLFPDLASPAPLVPATEAWRVAFDSMLGDQRRISSEAARRIEELSQAAESLERGDHQQALALLSTAVRKHAELPPARLMLARLSLLANQVEQGRAALERAAVENPDHPGVYLTLGELALGEGRLTDARLQLDKALALSSAPRWPPGQRQNLGSRIHAGLAGVAARREEWPAARTHLAAWLELEPLNGSIRQRLAQVLFELKEYKAAQDELERAAKDDHDLEPPAVSMAWLHTQKGNLEKASEWMSHAVSQSPEDPRTHLAMARWSLRQGLTDQARIHAEAAAERKPNGKDIEAMRGLIARHLKLYAEAESRFQAIHHESPLDASASNQLALVLAEQTNPSKRQRALELAEINARLYPDSAEALTTLGWVYYRLGRLDEAERALQAGRSAGSDAAYYLACVTADRGRQDDARQLLHQALDGGANFVFRDDARDWLRRIEANAPRN